MRRATVSVEIKQYRKKPVVIEAAQFDGTVNCASAIAQWMGQDTVEQDFLTRNITIRTLEGNMEAAAGDWIIKGVAGEFYPCKPKIFEATYEAAE